MRPSESMWSWWSRAGLRRIGDSSPLRICGKRSENGAYAAMASRAADGMVKNYSGKMLSSPELIAQTVEKAVTKRRPRTRYLVGFGASHMVWTRKLLGDRAFDWVIRHFS